PPSCRSENRWSSFPCLLDGAGRKDIRPAGTCGTSFTAGAHERFVDPGEWIPFQSLQVLGHGRLVPPLQGAGQGGLRVGLDAAQDPAQVRQGRLFGKAELVLEVAEELLP